MKIIIAVIMIITLASCAETRAFISTYGAEGADAQLESAEWAECKLPSAGALERRYNLFSDINNPKSAAWRNLCYANGNSRPTTQHEEATP